MLQAVFYARFHPERGPSVIHQYPKSSVVSGRSTKATASLIAFSEISAYIIPPYELCDRAFSVTSNGHRVLGFPVSLEDPKYERNRFTFNVCFVLREEDDAQSWPQIVAKTVAFFRSVEEEDGLLQAEEMLPELKWAGDDGYPAKDVGIVHTLLQAIMEDLNSYQETCIRIDAYHTLNLRLSQQRLPPPKIQAWDVPLLIRPLPSSDEWTCDLTLQRILPHIDGIKPVQRIAELADVELKLVKRAVRQLLFHDRALLLDLFHFSAIYASTADITWLVNDDQMLEECCTYVAINPSTNSFADGLSTHQRAETQQPSSSTILDLCTSLIPGLSLHDFVLTHQTQLSNIDIRRLITFGIIKGFLHRIHKYALALPSSAQPLLSASNSSPSKSKPKSNEDAVKDFDRAWKRAALSSGWATPPTEPPAVASLGRSAKSTEEARGEEEEKLRDFLDGQHCFDEICLAMRMSERKVVERLRSGRFGEVVLFNK